MNKIIHEGAAQIAHDAKGPGDPYDMAVGLEDLSYQALGIFQGDSISDAKALTTEVDTIITERVNARIKGETPGIPQGINTFDAYFGGYKPGRLYYVGGRPGMGKTTFMLSGALHQILNGYNVGFLSLEMTKSDLVFSMMSNMGSIYRDIWEAGEIGYDEYIGHDGNSYKQLDPERFQTLKGEFSELPIFIDDTPGLTSSMLRNKAKTMVKRNGIQILYIDYVQLAIGKGNNNDERMKDISGSIRDLCKALNIPIVAGSQLSRAVETRGGDMRPMPSDMRESGNLEQDAAAIIFPFRAEVYGTKNEHFRTFEDGSSTKGIVQIDIAKNRFGPTGEVRAKFQGHYARMCSPDPDQYKSPYI